jgi:hypothetical protein
VDFRGTVGTAVNPGLDDIGIGAGGPAAVGVFSAMTRRPKQFARRKVCSFDGNNARLLDPNCLNLPWLKRRA